VRRSIHIALFGDFLLEVEGQLVTSVNTPRLQSLLARLILQGQTPQPRERLASLLWPESSGAQARTNLRQLLYHLQRALPEQCDAIEVDHSSICWRRDDTCSVDVELFGNAIAIAKMARDKLAVAKEIEALTQAVALYRDDLLPSLCDSWLLPLRENLRSELSAALYRLALLHESRTELQLAIACAEKLIVHASLRESHYQFLFRLHVANHDRASAIRTYHQLKSALRRELGVQPGPETIGLFEQALKRSHALARGSTRAPSKPSNPRRIVGRVVETQRLKQAWTAALNGRAGAAIVSGEPGIGKTRLAADLLQDLREEGHSLALARCYSNRGQLAYAPVADWLRSDPLRATWVKLSSLELLELARLVPEIRETSTVIEAANSTVDSWRKMRLYEALNAAFSKLSAPIVLFLDDLQWCDADSFEWLCQLLTSPSARGILFLGTVRAEETGRDHPFTRFMTELRQGVSVSEVPLSPLDSALTMELATLESVEPLLDSRLEAIVRSTQGNPLFVIESVRSGLESTRVHAVISARLANLSAPSHELAGLASIVGRPFSFELLEKASDWDQASLVEALDELWQRRIIEGGAAAEYDFTHDRLREVARAELSPVRARYLHRRVARALTDLHREQNHSWSGQIASHFEQAGMREQAIEHLLLAAQSSRQRFAYIEAAALLRRALVLERHVDVLHRGFQQELDILLLLGTVLVTTDGYSALEVGATYGRALELARPLGGTKYFASLSGLWVFHVVRGEVETSRQDALEFMQGTGRQVLTDLTLAGNFLLGSSLSHLGQFEASLHHLTIAAEVHKETSTSVLEVFGGPDVRAFCRAYLSHVAWHRAPNGEDQTADHFITEALRTAEQMRHPFIQAIALNYAAMLYSLKGDSCSTLRVGRQAVALCTENAFSYYLAMANVLVGWALAAEGDVDAGIEQFRLGLERMRSLGAELRLSYFYALFAQTYRIAGRLQEASASLSTGFAFASKNGEAWTLSELHRIQGDQLAADGRFDQATASYQKALDVAQRCGSLAFERRLAESIQRTANQFSLERS
jgi:DNA-binding SARP family transcriptional activator/predicted ATPase